MSRGCAKLNVHYSNCCFPPAPSNLDIFTGMLPTLKNVIVGSVDHLCDEAVAKKLMTREERAEILKGDNDYKKASRFLEHFSLRIEVDPSGLQKLKEMLKELGTWDDVLKQMGMCMVSSVWGVYT